MAVATTIPRYNKYQMLFIDNEEITLIDHLKNLRTENKITKKRISNLIKQNDSWYSQIERSGKNGDDNRQRTIYKPDLINIISIIKYNANSISDLENCHEKSEVYIDKIIKAVPLTESVKKLEIYQLGKHSRTKEEQDNLFNSLMSSINKSMRQAFEQSSPSLRDSLLESLKNMNSSLKIDPIFIIGLAGISISQYLYESTQESIDSLLQQVFKSVDGFAKSESSVDPRLMLKELESIFNEAEQKSMYLRRKRYEFLPSDQVEV